MAILVGHRDGAKILEMFGVDSKYCIEADIRIRPNEVITVSAKFYASMKLNEDGELDIVEKRYQVIEIEDEL